MICPVRRLEPVHLVTARFLLGWSARELSEASHVAESTIRRFESKGGRLQDRTNHDLRRVLEEAGIVFGEGEPGDPHHKCADGLTLTLVRPPAGP